MSGRLLGALLTVELLLGWLWIGPWLLAREPGLGVVYWIFLTAPVQLACMLAAVWRFVKHPAERRLAAAVFVAPIALLVAPGMLRSASEPPLFDLGGNAVAVAWAAAPFALPLALCLLAPRRAARWLPGRLVRSRAVHVALVALAALGWLAWIGLALAWAAVAERDASGILLGALVACSGTGLLGWAAIALYGWVSLFSEADTRNHRLRLVQLALSLPAFPVFLGALALLARARGSG
ncbi:MAG: hypothetical protein ACQGVK_04055 [Myxococcota bacterium]